MHKLYIAFGPDDINMAVDEGWFDEINHIEVVSFNTEAEATAFTEGLAKTSKDREIIARTQRQIKFSNLKEADAFKRGITLGNHHIQCEADGYMILSEKQYKKWEEVK